MEHLFSNGQMLFCGIKTNLQADARLQPSVDYSPASGRPFGVAGPRPGGNYHSAGTKRVRLCGFTMNFLLSNKHWPAQSPRVGFVLFLDKKNQKSSHQEGFFARWPAHYPLACLCPANRAEPRAAKFCPVSLAHSPRFCKK